jgi:hypothetical protein
MLRKSLGACVAIAALFVLAANVQETQAQGRRGGGGGMRGPQGVNDLSIASSKVEAVKKELGLKPEQAEKLKDLADDVREEVQSQLAAAGVSFAGLQEATPEERQKKMAEMQTKMAEVQKAVKEKFMPKLAEVLDKTQLKRVHEIAIQAAGVQALLDPGVQKDLAVTAEQKDKLTSLSKDFAKQIAEVPRAERMAKMHELNEEQLAKSTELLTKEQQAQFATMKGKPFDLKVLRPAGVGGRRVRTGRGDLKE